MDEEAQEPQDPSWRERVQGWTRKLAEQARIQLTDPPVWLLLVTLALALPKAWYTWSSEPIFSLGFLVVPWALWWVLKEPITPGRQTSLMIRGTLLVGALGLAGGGWYLASSPLALWGVAAALALVALERGVFERSVVAAALVALTAPPPAFERLLVDIQQAVAWASGGLLSLLGTPVVRDTFYLHTPNYTFVVAPICTGLSSLLATVALVGMVATHWQAPRRRLATAVGVGIGAALVLNIARIVGSVMAAEAWSPTVVEGVFHGAVSLLMALVAFGLAVPLLDDERQGAQAPPEGAP